MSAALLSLCAMKASAQVVTPKTVPVRQDCQFSIFPSTRAGMADVGLALDDTLADPFGNPAKAGSIRSSVMFALPFTHGVSAGRGGGTTLPIGGFLSGADWVGGGVLAMQRLDQAGSSFGNRTASNQYASGVLAKRLANGVTVGGSLYGASLNAVDGTDLLYQGNDQLLQSGSLFDARLGMMRAWGRQRLEAEIVHNRTDITQDVHFAGRTFPQTVPARQEHNVDKTLIWSGHTQYVRVMPDSGWRIGAIATASRLSHPKIPNYQIQNIPRDPGTTWGFNLGLGVARLWSGNTFGVDFVQEPMVANTWGTADRDTATAGGGTIRTGDRTVSNHFRFTNSHVRIGYEHDFISRDSLNRFGLQLGLASHSINYTLHQTNHVQGNERWQSEGWTEWTPTVGLRWTEKAFALQYTYRRTCGPSSCMEFFSCDMFTVPSAQTG
jgi:hypothetical protein